MQSAGCVQHVKNGVLYRAREVWIRAFGRLPKGEVRKAGKDDQATIDTHHATTKYTNLTDAEILIITCIDTCRPRTFPFRGVTAFYK